MGYLQLLKAFWREFLIALLICMLVLQNNKVVRLESDIVAKDYQISVCAKNQENFDEAINNVNAATKAMKDETEKARAAMKEAQAVINSRPKPEVIIKTIDRPIPSKCDDKFIWLLEQNDAYEAKWGEEK